MQHPIVYAFLEQHAAHDRPAHPENSRRLHTVKRLLAANGVFDTVPRVPCDPVDKETLMCVHSRKHILTARELSRAGGGLFDPDTYATEATYDVALRAAGGVVEVARAVVRGDAVRGMAIVRPPGHHAVPDGAMGFCIFNSIAVAARAVAAEQGVERVAIIDFDVHHGNGTQDAFYEDPNVLFASTHQYPFYPGTGAAKETGAGEGRGTNINAPLPAGCGDAALRRVFSEILAPAISRFRPEIIFISAGFDAHHSDPLGGLTASISGFAGLVQMICGWADEFAGGRVVAALEGGYDTDVLAYSVLATLLKLRSADANIEDPFGRSGRSEPDVERLITKLRALHRL